MHAKMSKKGNTNNHFGKRTSSQIETDEEEKIDTSSKMRYDNNFSKLEHQMKKILKTEPSDNNKIARISRRSILLNHEYEQ